MSILHCYCKVGKEKATPVGSGSYGDVYKAIDKRTGKLVAWKTIKFSILGDGLTKSSLREIAVLKHLNHPCVVKLLDQECSNGKFHMVFEYIDNNLLTYLHSTSGFLKPEAIKSLTVQLIQGIDYCHMRGIMHRDLKPPNILVSKGGQLKIADFGLARAFVTPSRRLTNDVVTLWYRPPEILLGDTVYSLSMDMWAVGAIIAELFIKIAIFPGDSEIDELYKIFRLLGTPHEEMWPGVTNLLNWNQAFPMWPTLKISNYTLAKLCPLVPPDNTENPPELICPEGINLIQMFLQMDPKRRMTAREALGHPFVKGSEQYMK